LVVSDNILHVNNELLRVDLCTPRELERVLVLGHTAIVRALDEMYEQQSQIREELALKTPNIAPVQRGSIWAMLLAETAGKVITPAGLEANKNKQFSRGVYADREAITPLFRPYWDAVVAADFLPEVRTTGNASLLLRDVPLVDPRRNPIPPRPRH